MKARDPLDGMHDFDFLLGPWAIHNRRRPNAMLRGHEGEWEEFTAHLSGVALLEGRVMSEQYEGALPTGKRWLRITICTFDPQTREWSIRWLDNCQPPDYRPLVGRFENEVERFYQVIEAPDGHPLHVLYMWDEITTHTARWQQAFALHGGEQWETNWVMALTKAR